MRIYLDSNVLQDLKEHRYKDLLNLIRSDRPRNVYCFSEAHLHDLNRDKTEIKYTDMDFIESIVENNCWYYDKNVRFKYRTPKEYYKDFTWDEPVTLFDEDNDLGQRLKAVFSMIPFNFSEVFNDPATPEPPESLKSLFEQPVTVYDFMVALFDHSADLSEDQKKFKKLLQYLHADFVHTRILQGFGIKGYENGIIADLETFRQTFTDYIFERWETQTQLQRFHRYVYQPRPLGVGKR